MNTAEAILQKIAQQIEYISNLDGLDDDGNYYPDLHLYVLDGTVELTPEEAKYFDDLRIGAGE